MGRKPEKGDVHVYVYVNHGAAHQKQTNKPCNIVSHLYTDTKYKLHKENADSSPWALVTGAAVTSPKPGQACFPRMDCHGADGAGEDVPANEPCRMALMSLFPSAATHNLQIQVGPPAAKLWLLYPKDGGASGLEEL